jgi:hypothetical protein
MRERKALLFLSCVALFVWFVRYFPPGVDAIIFDDDARQHVYWTAVFQDPDLFPDDILTQFISSRLFDPPGYQAVYWLGVKLMEPLDFSRLLTLGLLLASVWLLDALLRGITGDWRDRFFCELLFLFFCLYSNSGGLPRGFAFPLLLLFLLLMQRGAFRWASITAPLVVVFYPPLILNVLALAGWDLLRRLPKRGRTRDWLLDAVSLGIVSLIAGFFLFSVYGSTSGEFPGAKVTFEQTKLMPEFYPGGRTVFFRESALAYFLREPSGIGFEYVAGFGAILIIMVGMKALGGRRGRDVLHLPGVAVDCIWTSLFLFGVAHAVLFKLHHPSRYTLYTLPTALIIIIGANTRGCLAVVSPVLEWVRRKASRGVILKGIKWGSVVALLVCYAYLQACYISKVDPLLVRLDRVEIEMLDKLKTLPKDSLVAGHPMDMNNPPLIAQRKVLANQELSLPYYQGYYGEVRARIFDFFEAYYASDWSVVEGFIRRYGVDALVVNKEHFKESFLSGPIYYEPFRSVVKERLKKNRSFVLMHPPENVQCFENEHYVILCFASK